MKTSSNSEINPIVHTADLARTSDFEDDDLERRLENADDVILEMDFLSKNMEKTATGILIALIVGRFVLHIGVFLISAIPILGRIIGIRFFLAVIDTVADHIAWSYANVARADAALQDGVTTYQRTHHMIRSKLFHGLKNGTMAMRSLYDDKRMKMTVPEACYYCASKDQLSVDHLIPRIRGGADDSDNLIWACRSCNSSKQGRGMLEWMNTKKLFPAILLLRRYLKLVARYCDENNLLLTPLPDALQQDLPFDLSLIPHSFPP